MISDLNSKQQEIVENGDGVVIINAGPGTGKTKTLTSRVAFLINQKKINPQDILILTFTNRAAEEMKSRLKTILGDQNLPIVTTFHSWAFDFLTGLGQEIDIIPEEEREKIIKQIIKEEETKLSTKDLDLEITRTKNNLDYKVNPEIKQLIDLYNQKLLEKKYKDFDDLLLETLKTLKEKDKKYQFVLVDEFQDTNNLQYQIIKLILRSIPNLFVIGDPLQSIYGFRGADSEIFTQLKYDFPKNREEFLETNYRSFVNIVEISNLLFPNFAKNKSASLLSGRVSLINTLNEYSESDWIINFINQKIGGTDLLTAQHSDEHITFADFAVIYRTHYLSLSLQKKLAESGLPFQVVKEDSYLEGDHIKLLSMHAAKGLEFKYVFICGFEEELIPQTKSDSNLEEEKRLLYVALTRAKEGVYLISARKRNGKPAKTSQFKKLLEHPKFEEKEDENLGKIFKKREKAKVKKSQLGLFN